MDKFWTVIQNMFSAPSLAAIRNVLTAGAVFLGALGIAGLTSSNLQGLVDKLMAVGTAGATLITAISAMVAVAMPLIASLKSTFAAQRKSVSANQPHTIVVQAQSAADISKIADAVATMPEVKQVVASPRVADEAPSAKVVAG